MMRRDILILIAVASVILLFNLGGGSLSSWDEAFYAEVSREILETNNWIDLTWGGSPWSDKPPLYMWVTAVFYKMFGVNEFSARLFSALSGTGIVILTYLFAARLFSRRAGTVSAAMLLSTYHFLWLSRMGTLDVTFTFFLLLSVYSFLRSEINPVNIVYSFIWFGFAFLTKGPAALLIPMILGLYVLLGRQWRMVLNRYTAFGVLAFLLITGSWYVAAFLHYGRSFLEGHFLQHLIGRTTRTMDGHYGNWLTYFNVVLYKGKPWGFLGLVSFPFLVFYTVKMRHARNYLVISWVLVVFLVFCLVRTKLHWYITPVYPAVMVTAGWGMTRLFKRRALVITVVISLLSIIYFGAKKDVFALDYNPAIKNFASAVRDVSSEDKGVYLYNISDPAMLFYFGGFSKNIRSEAELSEAADRKGAVIVASPEELEGLEGRGRIVPAVRADFAAIKIK